MSVAKAVAKVDAVTRHLQAEFPIPNRQDCLVGVCLLLGDTVQQEAVPTAVLFLCVAVIQWLLVGPFQISYRVVCVAIVDSI